MATRIRWKMRGFQQIRRMPTINEALLAAALKAKAKAELTGKGHYAAGVERGKTRSRAYVVTVDPEAMADEAENHTLSRALSSEEAGE